MAGATDPRKRMMPNPPVPRPGQRLGVVILAGLVSGALAARARGYRSVRAPCCAAGTASCSPPASPEPSVKLPGGSALDFVAPVRETER
jgi:hypothetical protein